MRDLPRPDAVLDVRTTYGVVRVYRWNGPDPAARPLVLLPGRAAGTPMWADNLPSLRALRTVYALDLLGEPGESVQQRPIVDHEDQARWLDETFVALPADRVHLLGHSIGGWTAMNLALRRPGKLASVSVLDPVQTFAPIPLGTVLRSVPASVWWLPKGWRDAFNSYTAGGAPVRDVPVADMIEAGMQTYRLGTPTPTQITEQQLAGLRVPALAVVAGRSVMPDPVAATDVARRSLSGATVLSYPQATHALVGEAPARIARDVGTFVAGVDR